RTGEDRPATHGANRVDVGSGAARGRWHAGTGGVSVDRIREPLPTHVRDTSPLPDAYAETLDRGLAELGLTLDPQARAAIDGHARLLLAWTTAINLTAIREPAAVALEHVIDSLTALAVVRERTIDRFVDLGSGGGYPGLPLAAALPARRVILLEPIAK